MDFFEYASFAMNFTDTLWVQFLIGGLCFLIVFVFEAIALYTIARREGYKNKWMACIPFFNTYYIGVCAQKNRFYNIDTKKIGIAAAVFEAVIVALYIVYYVACITMLKSDVAPTVTTSWLGIEQYFYEMASVPDNLKWAAWMYDYMYEYILSFLDLFFCLLQVVLLICFFHTYACRRYVLFTITSILFPIQGILFFVVRNNSGINYKDFVNAEQARQYRMYQQYQQQNYQNPYNRDSYGQNPYNNGYNASGNYSDGNSSPDDPFSDLGGSGSDSSPFDDFDKN